jgi:hypothetical protein
LPDGVEPWVIGGNPVTIPVLERHAEVLEDLESLRTVPNILLQLCRGPLAPSGIIDAVVIQVGEHGEPVRVAALHGFYGLREAFTCSPAQIHHDTHIHLVHGDDERIDACG